MHALLNAFTDFYRMHAESWLDRYVYKEAGPQLLLMAFLQRIINGGDKIDREMAVGNGRADLVIHWKGQQHVIEIKLKRNSSTIEQGTEQLVQYLDRIGQDQGYLIIFETRPTAEISWTKRISQTEKKTDNKTVSIWTL